MRRNSIPSREYRDSTALGSIWAIGIFAAAVYALMWVGYRMHWDWLDSIDQTAVNTMHDYAVGHPSWVRGWDVFCTVFGPEGFRVFGAIVVVVAALRRNFRDVLFVVVTIGLSGLLTEGAKTLADRPRPAGALVAAGSTSFPSGHAVAVMAAVLALLTLSSAMFTARLWAITCVAGALIVLAVGAGRVVLVVHYPSDVVAGWALGYLWFLLWLRVIRPSVSHVAVAGTPEAPGNER